MLVAVGHYVGEGFDDARLDTLFLAMPVSWKGTLAQYAGRLHRLHPAKREVVVHDYVDRDVPILRRMSEKRIRGYRRLGYAVEDGGGLGLWSRRVCSDGRRRSLGVAVLGARFSQQAASRGHGGTARPISGPDAR